ncbi:leucyl aminopeptidase family protein [Sphingomonas ginkgonis]|uniref:Leucyl aminopeptidase family protein n=1 Tax=Sphingomonas ginkgonis TaxID=2315330 RepID=A0A3R9YLF7_9SPHN|nr:leucyl aminopeptidase family protein [Sphingomonas ginkgonis]RST30454.1 leucyl aminopeptidase family protein [Sphingomonas ginkgonis]
MTRFADLLQPDRGQPASTLHLVDSAGFDTWLKGRPAEHRALLEAQRFDGKAAGTLALLPAGERVEAVLAVADPARLTPWCLAAAADRLPAGNWRLSGGRAGAAGLGWLLAQHRFDRYRSKPEEERGGRVLLTDQPAAIGAIVREAEATALVRELVNTPAADMGPGALEAAARSLADEAGAEFRVTAGDSLETDYPMIHAVGRAAAREHAPRLIELEWGDARNPRVAIVGKGVCFDTGGLDLKPASGMRLMKKDMGGAAHALALTRLVIGARLPLRLHLLIPAVENSVGGNAFRPGDVLISRAGKTVEVDNTDAEGRLVLADAITRAGEEAPALVIDLATLTGAARVALGPDLPATFVNDEELASQLLAAAGEQDDPLWRMPLWDGYDDMLKSDIADMANSGDSPFAGSVTAALFLRRFVPEATPWVHLDVFAWRPAAKPGRPKGGDAMGLRAMLAMLAKRCHPQTSSVA